MHKLSIAIEATDEARHDQLVHRASRARQGVGARRSEHASARSLHPGPAQGRAVELREALITVNRQPRTRPSGRVLIPRQQHVPLSG